MKWVLNVLISFISIGVALVSAIYAARPFIYHVHPGFNEGTPVTMFVFIATFLFTFGICLSIGLLLVNQYFRSRNLN